MNEYPIYLEWIISEDCLKAVKDSKSKCLESDKFTAFHDSDIQYSLLIFPYGDNPHRPGLTIVYLHIVLENGKKIDADCMISVKSGQWSRPDIRWKGKFDWGITFGTAEFFDPEKKFIVDGKLTIKIKGILKIPNAEYENEMKLLQTKWKYDKNFGDLWDKDSKDFTIFAKHRVIKVHKHVICHHSKTLAQMSENNYEIKIYDVPFKIVEMFIKHCYNRILVSKISVEEAMSLLNFAEKYVVEDLKDNLEELLAAKLAPSNVCKIMKCATEENALKLQNKCLEYFVECLSKKFLLPYMSLIEKDFLISFFTKFSSQQNQISAAAATEEKALKLQNKCSEYFLECLTKKEFVSNMKLLDKNVFTATIEKYCCQCSETL